MQLVTLPAHFDGKKICLDEPFALIPNTKLIVTILSEYKKPPRTSLRLGNLSETMASLPHLSEKEAKDFEMDIQKIKKEFWREELKDPWE